MALVIHTDIVDVHTRLKQLGLSVAALHEAIQQGYLARTALTPNHPRIFFGFAMWAQTVAALRDNLRPDGWLKFDDGNYELTINQDTNLAVAVTTGDEGTGLAHLESSNKCQKGINTVNAIAVNNQLDLFADLLPPVEGRAGFTTWVLLIHIATDEVRAELSLPLEISNGKIKFWKERIILPALPREDDVINVRPPQLPEIDVPIKRKA